jgi:hypothetical protein
MLGLSTPATTMGGPRWKRVTAGRLQGVGLHRRRSVLVRMTPDGRRLGSARIANPKFPLISL